jgi:hypothetical protein
MKFLCIILSFYIATLSVDLCCQEDYCGDETEMKIADQHADQHDEDSSDNCSPFLSCGSSTGFVAEDINTYATYWTIEPANIPSNIPFTRDYTPNIWQPPKLS